MKAGVMVLGLVLMSSCLDGVEAARSPMPGRTTDLVATDLMGSTTAIVPGRPFLLGVRFRIQSGWHIYWSYSGDAGKPTQVNWTLPAGFRIGPLQYPAPISFADPGDLVSFGYKDQVVLWSEVTPPGELRPGDRVRLVADASWLACKEQCILGARSLSMELPVAASADVAKPANEEVFASARRLTPVPSEKADRLRVRTGASVDRIRPGDRFEWGVELAIDKGWHIQSHSPFEEGMIATDLVLAPPESIALDRPVFPPGKVVEGQGGTKQSLYEGRVLIRVPARATADVKPGRIEVSGVLTVQPCSEEGTCLRPQYLAVRLSVESVAAGSSTRPVGNDFFGKGGDESSPPAAGIRPAHSAPARSLPYLLMAAFLAGLILNIMPCVLPVVSIKILSFVQQSGEQPARVLQLGLSFALGMMLFFWGLGVLAVIVPVSPGSALRHPEGVIVLTAVIFAFALSLLGVYEIHLPGSAAAQMGQAAGREGPLGAVAKVFLATVLGTSCTAPVVSTVWVSALAASVPVRLLIFTAMGVGMAGPYILLSAKPAWLRFLPRPGQWMETFKQFMGFIMLATDLWLLWILGGQLGTDGVVWTLVALTLLAMGLWLVGRVGYGASLGRWCGFHLGALLLAGAGVLTVQYKALPEARAAEAREMPHPAAGSMPSGLDFSKEIPWQRYEPGLAQRLASTGKIVYVDYTARWCATCQSNKRLVLETQAVREAMRRLGVIPIKADFTNGSPDIERDLASFSRPSVPLNLVYGPGHVSNPIVLPELLTRDRVLEALNTAALGRPDSSSPDSRPVVPSSGRVGGAGSTVGALWAAGIALGGAESAPTDPAGKDRVSISGHAFDFNVHGGKLKGGEVVVLERPDLRTITGDDGSFRIDDLVPGSCATLVLKHPGHQPTQTATFTLGRTSLKRVSFQVPPEVIFAGYSVLLGIPTDPNCCHLATTVTRKGESLYGSIGPTHGEPGATVTIEPPLPRRLGPIYFNLSFTKTGMQIIWPDRLLKETTKDGGVLFVNVPPGEYTLRAHKEGKAFTSVKVKCRPGVLVNASPPWGLQAE